MFRCRWRRTVSHIPGWQVRELADCANSCGCLQRLGWENTFGSWNVLRQLQANASSRFACRPNYLNADKDAGIESAACLRRNTLCSHRFKGTVQPYGMKGMPRPGFQGMFCERFLAFVADHRATDENYTLKHVKSFLL